MAIAKVDIFNLALTMLGAQTVSSPTENSKNAKTCLAVYDMLRQGELRKKPSWNFSIKLASLAASATAPLFDRAYSYPLPVDFLSLVPPFPESNSIYRDEIIQNGQIYSNYSSPFQLRYVADITDPNEMDHLFRIALAAKLADTVSDAIVQSNSKMDKATERYEQAIYDARKSNAFDQLSANFPEDLFLTVRL